MQIKPFRIEHYFAKHEFSARFLLASSDAESRRIQEVLDLEPGSHERFLKHWCGTPNRRALLRYARRWQGFIRRSNPNQALNVSCAEEGILLAYHAWLKAGDHVIVETPCFESALELARSTGAEVSEWRRRSEDSWSHDVEGLTTADSPEHADDLHLHSA